MHIQMKFFFGKVSADVNVFHFNVYLGPIVLNASRETPQNRCMKLNI